ncbi:hypothetical protein [Actinopolyspora saharensis]
MRVVGVEELVLVVVIAERADLAVGVDRDAQGVSGEGLSFGDAP